MTKQDFKFELKKILGSINEFVIEFKEFLSELGGYLYKNLYLSFVRFELLKNAFAIILYRQRGKYARRAVHFGMVGLSGLGIILAPIVANEFPGMSVNPWSLPSPAFVLSASTEGPQTVTLISEKARDKVIQYTVQEGDTVGSVAEKFGVSVDTVLWQNNLGPKDKIKVGQTLEILPVTGVSHKVAKGDTVYSIAKKYDASPQAIVDFPFNTFVNDETFELAIGQIILVPDGVKPEEKPTAPRIRQITPDAGTVVALGTFVWPAGGRITQGFSWYHKGIDVANSSAPDVLAADSGKVVIAGWIDGYGYGNRVVIDHGNGYRTLYAHLSKVYVVAGQSVARGSAIGKMGSTGRSTGIHLHFEVIQNGVYLNPLSVLR